jgi:hypothetical protein
MNELEPILNSLSEFWSRLSGFLPRLAFALALLTAGWIVGRLLQRTVEKICKLIRLDVLSEKIGIEDFLLQGGVRYTAVTLLANLVYWTVLFIAALAALNVRAATAATALLDRFISFIPNVLVAMIILVFGSLLARVVQGASYTWLNNIGLPGSSILSAVTFYTVLVFVISLALEQLAFGGPLLVSAFQIAFGALCLALALAFGLGAKDWAARLIDRFTNKKG